MTSLTDTLAKLRSVAEAATPGPWISDVWYGDLERNEWAAVGPKHEQLDDDGSGELDPSSEAGEQAERDAAHIAAFSPSQALRLIRALELSKHALEKIMAFGTTSQGNTFECQTAYDALAAIEKELAQ